MNTTQALYRFFDENGELLYVGVTLDPSARWKQHRADKAWWHEVAGIKIAHFPDRRSVLDAEREAIKAEKPRYNVVHNTGRPQVATQSAPVLDRLLPVQVGDWAALGLTSGDCPVGEIIATDEQLVSIRLKNFASGHLTNRVQCVRWDEIERIELALPEDADRDGEARLIDDGHLGVMQDAWHASHGWGASAYRVAYGEALRTAAQMRRGR